MVGRQVAVRESIGQLFECGPVAGLDDRELLERFAAHGDEAAFAALVALHGPMVLGVCRRLLRDVHDVEDAFQATFLVLVRRARSIRDPGRLGPWLHGVARRVAMRSRAQAIRHRSRQETARTEAIAEDPDVRRTPRADGDDVLELIDAEVARLPAPYREAVVLCDLEGRSYAEAARRLRCPLGTLQSRLARGRSRLRTRLVRRGVAPAAVTAILTESARSAVPDSLAEATIRAATAGAVPATAAALAGYAARGLILSSVATIAKGLIVAAIALGAGRWACDRLAAGPPPAAVEDAQSEPPRTDRTLVLDVVDNADRSPLAGATVWVRADWRSPRDSEGTTDADGRYTIPIPAAASPSLRVVIVHHGFSPIEVRWAGDVPMPDSYTVGLGRGVAIGGTVRDDRGRPIAGARVHLQISPARPQGGGERYPEPDAEIAAAGTDTDGRWRSDALPAAVGPGARVGLVTTHPDHVAVKQAVTVEALRGFTVAGVLKTGRSLAGTVRSPTGRPVAGATVFIQSRSDRTMVHRVRSDREGRFRTGPFIDPEWSEFTLVVQADGFASAAQTLLVPNEIPPQDIRLSPRKPLRGRVIDAQGRPLPGAVVRSATEFGSAGLDWEAATDADGRFVWYEAPAAGTYMLDLEKPPFRPIVALMVAGGSDDLAITLHRPQRLHGMVTDAATGRPIERFVVIEGRGPIRPGWSPDWHRDSAPSFGGGKYDLTRSGIEQQMVRSIRVEADGYEPAEFLGFPDGTEDIAHDFELRRTTRLAGVVRGLDGRPISGADVVLTGAGFDASVEDGRLAPSRSGGFREPAPRTCTGPDGRYEFRRHGERASVIAVHAVGFAMQAADELAASGDLTLAPWGRIEGVVKIGARPVGGARIVASLRTWGGVRSQATTDGSGRFVMERVAPGRITVYRRVKTGDGWMASHPVSVDARPGEAVHLQLGGTGRPVVGRLAIPEGIKLSQLAVGYNHGELVPVLPDLPAPDDYLIYDSDRRAAWWQEFTRTPEGRTYIEDQERSYAVELRPDGTFRVEDVPAGRYALKIPFEGLSRSSREGRQAFAHAEVIVPEGPGGPLDIGAIPLEVFPFHEPRVGERAPTFDRNLADGRPLDLRGKFVLLHFWSGRPEDAAIIPHLKATFDAFGRDPRFVMIGLIADETPGPVRRYCARHGLSWDQRYIGSTYDPNRFEAAFGVWFPPAAFLIGPEGRIRARHLEGDAIRLAVAAALASRPQPMPPEEPVEPQAARERTLTLEIAGGDDRKPLPGASVWAQLNWKLPRIIRGKADEEGRYTIGLPAGELTGLRVCIAHPGFAPLESFWAGDDPIPESQSVALERGVPIGGTVRDEQGRPIAGARVHLSVFARPRGAGRYPDEECENAAAFTDDQGRWRSETLPAAAAPGAPLELLTTHPDHIAVEPQRVTANALRALATAVVMKAGRSVSGTVSSPTGRPVVGATVTVQHRNGVGTYARLRTDDRGAFRTGRFLDPTWDDLTLTVQADDFASVVRRLANTPEIPPQVVQLLPRQPFQGRVVDSRGRPVAGVLVTPAWSAGFGRLEWEARTDADGRFRWFEAPASGTFLIEVHKAGFRPIEYKEAAAGMENLTLTLHRPQHLHGTVTDAETGRPIERFMLLSAAGARYPGFGPHWERGKARSFTDGRFDLIGERSSDQDTFRSIRIEADGYEPAEWRDFSDHEDDVAHDFKLRRTDRKPTAMAGIVRDAAGRPVAGADVFLVDREHGFRLADGWLEKRDASTPYRAQTDGEGRYTFPPHLGDFWLAAVHDAGFARRSPAELVRSTDITLTPWGRIEGVAKVGREPAAGRRVAAYLQDRRFPGGADFDSATDRDGRFVFDRVAPGRWRLYLPVRQETHSVLSQLTHVDVAPGQTVRVPLGGMGRPVVGRLALPSGVAMNHLAGRATRLQSESPPLRLPPGSNPLAEAQWDAWWEAFLQAPECEDYYDGEHQYAVDFRPDGTFRIEDVPPGRYVLRLPFVGNAGADASELRAFARKDIVVPAMPGERSGEPLDIGTIPLEVFPVRNPGAGDRVTAATAKAADGRPLDLAGFRGRFVLLVFWRASQQMPRAFIPPVKATWDAFGRDPRLAIIGLNQDTAPETMRRYLAGKGLDWDQRYLGDIEDFDPISAAFGVRWPGGVFLIGPDGRLIARDLQGDAIRQAVARALR